MSMFAECAECTMRASWQDREGLWFCPPCANFEKSRERVDAAIAELRAAGTDPTRPPLRDVRVRLLRELGDGSTDWPGVARLKAIILAEKIEREQFGWFHDTLGEDGIAPVREALRDAVAAYLARTEAHG